MDRTRTSDACAAPAHRLGNTGHSVAFVVLALTFSWGPWGVLLLTTADHTADGRSWLLWGLGGLGPAVAAFAVVGVAEGRVGIRNRLARLRRWRLGRFGWLLLAPLAVGLAAVVLLVGATDAAWDAAGPGFLVTVPLLLIAGVFFGGLEELGWRGELQPRLQRRMHPAVAAVVVGLVWTLWHAPLFLLDSTTQAGTAAGWFTLGAIALSVVFAAVLNASGGNVVLLVLLHGALNGWYGVVVQGLAPDVLDAGFGAVTAVVASSIAVLVLWRSGGSLYAPRGEASRWGS